MAFSFTDTSSIDNFSLSFCLVNWLGMLISRNFFYCLFVNPHQHYFCQHLSVLFVSIWWSNFSAWFGYVRQLLFKCKKSIENRKSKIKYDFFLFNKLQLSFGCNFLVDQSEFGLCCFHKTYLGSYFHLWLLQSQHLQQNGVILLRYQFAVSGIKWWRFKILW